MQNNNQNQLLWVWINSQIQTYLNQAIIQKDPQEQIENVFQLYQIGFFDKMLLDIDTHFFLNQLQKIKRKQNKIMDLESFSKKIILYSQSINSYLIENCNKKLNTEYEQTYFNQSIFTEFSKNNVSYGQYKIKTQNVPYFGVNNKNKLLQYHLNNNDDDQNILSIQKDQLQRSFIELVKICFYLVLQSSNQQLQHSNVSSQDSLNQSSQSIRKNPQFIQRICNLPEQVQNYLMQQIKLIETQKIQKITELKQLLTDLQSLQEENQYYKEQIQAILLQNQKLQKRIQQQVLEQDKQSNEIIKYHQQKQQLFQQLGGISSLQQFIQIITNIQKQNQLLQNTISQLEEKNYDIQRSNAQSIHKINKNAQQITKINEQIDKFKKQIKGLNQDIQFYDQFCNNLAISIQNEEFQPKIIQEEQSFSNILKENQDIYNQKINNLKKTPDIQKASQRVSTQQDSIKRSNKINKKNHKKSTSFVDQNNLLSIESCQTFNKSKILLQYKQNQQEQDMINKQKEKYRNQLMKKLQNLYKQISSITSQITSVKQENKNIDRKNKVNQNKIRDLKAINQAFAKQLKCFQ